VPGVSLFRRSGGTHLASRCFLGFGFSVATRISRKGDLSCRAVARICRKGDPSHRVADVGRNSRVVLVLWGRCLWGECLWGDSTLRISFLQDLGLVRFSKGTCLVESSVLRETLSGEISSEKVSGLRFILGFSTWLTCGNPSCFSNNRFLPLTFGVFANHLSVLQGCSSDLHLVATRGVRLASFGSDRGSSISALGCGLQWWLAPMVVGSSGPWLSQLLLLHCTAKAILCMGSGGCLSLRAGRGYGRWESVTFSMFFLTWRCRGCLSFLFSPVALGICRGRMLAGETVMAVEPVCLLRHSSPAGWLARLHWQSTLLAC
jgi:hypothetical protein